MKRITLIALAVFAIVVLPATAAPPQQASLSIDTPAPYSFGQEIIVTTTTSGSHYAYAWTQMFCYQDGILVGVGAGDLNANDGGSYEDVFTLGPSQVWQSGAASCELRVYVQSADFRQVKVKATIAFEVAA